MRSQRRRSIAVAAVVAVAVVSVPHPPVSSETPQRIGQAPRQGARIRHAGPAGVHKAAHHETFTLQASFYDIRDRWRSVLTLNNKGADPMTPTITAYAANGRSFRVPTTAVPGDSFVELDLNELLADLGRDFAHGSLRVAYYGKKLEMGAQVLVKDLDAGLQFAEQLTYAVADPSGRTEAVWWMPPGQTVRHRVVVTNTTDAIVNVTMSLHDAEPDRPRGRPGDQQVEVRLQPRAQRLVDIDQAAGWRRAAPGGAGGATVVFDGGPGAVMARALLHDPRSGYSLSVPFQTPAAKTPTVHGTGVRVKDSSGTPMRPVFVARNTGTSRTAVNGRLVVGANAEGAVLALPVTSLEPGEARLLDVRSAWQAAAAVEDVTSVGIELEQASSPGAVVMSASTVSVNGDQVFTVPLIDPEAPPSSTGGYPWRADADTSTVVHLKNTTELPQVYLLQLSFPGGAYAPGLKTLRPGQSVTVDVRALRDQQVPDRLGRTIPRDATYGQVHWSAKGRERHVIIGRAEHVAQDGRVSASYACVNCCPDNPYENWSEPGSLALSPGSDHPAIVEWLRDIDCYDTVLEAYDLGNGGLQWQSSNTSVATVIWGEVTPVGGGSAYITGTYQTSWWAHEQNTDCEDDPYFVVYETPVQVQCAVPTNFRRTGASTESNGTLKVEYAWDSSHGPLSNLSACLMLERVQYPNYPTTPYSWPAPFQNQTANPTISAGFAPIAGAAMDTHSPSPSYSSSYATTSFDALQKYLYGCQCLNDNMAPHDASSLSTITRSVISDPWRYRIVKGPDSHTVNLPTEQLTVPVHLPSRPRVP